jgi:hypothetical protein
MSNIYLYMYKHVQMFYRSEDGGTSLYGSQQSLAGNIDL